MIVRLVLMVLCPTTQKDVSSVRSSQHMFDCLRQAPHVFDLLRLFQTLFRHHAVPDFLQFAGGVANGITLPVSILYAKARSGPKQTHCPCCVMDLTVIRGLRFGTLRVLHGVKVSRAGGRARKPMHRGCECFRKKKEEDTRSSPKEDPLSMHCELISRSQRTAPRQYKRSCRRTASLQRTGQSFARLVLSPIC